ncbi:MAG TPA: hypothetical protein VK851_13370 [Anaerolineales bacterium]|nr:hypothetical protein [Anaerolineales bacterium]
MLIETTRYELPPEGITLLGYIVRRMHKTEWLAKAAEALTEKQTVKALEYASVYAAASSTTFGRAYYQPTFDRAGDNVTEADPVTGAIVAAKLESTSPHYNISYQAIMPNNDAFKGSETITGTTVGLRGLGMPAPSKFEFTSGEYMAEFDGLITSELALSLLRNTRIRAFGFLNMKDNHGNTGRLELDRTGDISIRINERFVSDHSISKITWVNTQLPAPQPA